MELLIRDVNARDFDQVFGLLKQLWSYKELDYAGMKEMFDHNVQSPDHFYVVALIGPHHDRARSKIATKPDQIRPRLGRRRYQHARPDGGCQRHRNP